LFKSAEIVDLRIVFYLLKELGMCYQELFTTENTGSTEKMQRRENPLCAPCVLCGDDNFSIS